MQIGEKVLVYGAQFGYRDFEATLIEVDHAEVRVRDERGNVYACDIGTVIAKNAVVLRQQAVVNEYVLKNSKGFYVAEIGSRKVEWTDKLEKARRYTRKNHTTSSLKNYQGYGKNAKDISDFKVIKLRVIMTETAE